MRPDFEHIEKFRHTKEGTPMATKAGDRFGAFYIPYGKIAFVVIASDATDEAAEGWEHVSARVSGHTEKDSRTPNWEEMCWIKQLFWDDEECVMQLHPPRKDYVNNHPHVLHLWKSVKQDIPRPPSILVGIK